MMKYYATCLLLWGLLATSTRAKEEAKEEKSAELGLAALKALKEVMGKKDGDTETAESAQQVVEPAQAGLTWNEAEVIEWLKKEGFGAYTSGFATHKIDGPALSSLLEEDLKEIGMSKIGVKRTFARKLCEALPDCTIVENRDMATWPVDKVGEWLLESGLGEFKSKFAQHELDGAALTTSEMTEEELKSDLGMSKIGQRKLFRRRLCEALPDCKIDRTDQMVNWTAAQVQEWLDAEGFSDYKLNFQMHGIDGMGLPELTEEDLKNEMLVPHIGARKLLRFKLCKLDPQYCDLSPEEARVQQEQQQWEQYLQQLQARKKQKEAEEGSVDQETKKKNQEALRQYYAKLLQQLTKPGDGAGAEAVEAGKEEL